MEALRVLARGLRPELPAAVAVVLHVRASSPSAMPHILSREGPLEAVHPAHGDPIVPGRIYVAPPDHHLLVKPGRVELSRGPRENRVRPAVDVLFRSAAIAYAGRVIGVILTGALDDGAAGLAAIKQCGGLAVVQDPRDALTDSMPRAALEAVAADHVVPIAQLGALLSELVTAPAGDGPPVVPPELAMASEASQEIDGIASKALAGLGERTLLSCPECGGTVSELSSAGLTQFRCHIGHAYSMRSLASDQGEALGRALASALRLMDERVDLLDTMARERRAHGQMLSAGRYEARARRIAGQADQLRALLADGGEDPEPVQGPPT